MNIHSIIKKCNKEYGSWCGCLQPIEIIKLCDSGLIDPNLKNEYEDAKDRKAKGSCNQRWFYFAPKPKFLELHRGLKHA